MSIFPHTCECYICHREMEDVLREAQSHKNAKTLASLVVKNMTEKEALKTDATEKAQRFLKTSGLSKLAFNEPEYLEAIEVIRALMRTNDDPSGKIWDAACIPEECKLKAHHTGDAWLLYVEDRHGKTIAYLTWPKNWPENVSEVEVRGCGFEIEP